MIPAAPIAATKATPHTTFDWYRDVTSQSPEKNACLDACDDGIIEVDRSKDGCLVTAVESLTR